MKRKVASIAIIAALTSLAVGGTLAYYTAEDVAHNVITSGSVGIELVEKHVLETGEVVDWPEEDGGVLGVCPGARVSKIVRVEGTGASDAWVRASVSTAIFDIETGEELPVVLEDGTPALTYQVLDGWSQGSDGWYYYNAPLQPGAQTRPLFTEVVFDVAMGNEYQTARAVVTVEAEAVQRANNGSVVTEAQGWPNGGGFHASSEA